MAAKKNRTATWIIVGLLLVGLVGFGTTNLSGSVRHVARVGDKTITVQAYVNELRRQLNAFSAQIGTQVSFPQALAIGLDQAVLGNLIAARTLDNEMARLGVSVGDVAVRDTILGLPAFRGLDGTFSRDTYARALQSQGLTEAEFEAQVRDDLARTLIQQAILAGIAEPATFADTLLQYTGERRSFEWARVGPEVLTDPLPDPTEAELAATYEGNPDAFTTPEIRHISYAWLTPEMIQDKVTVDPEAVRALYDQRIADFVQPERRLVERLVYPDAAAAAAARARLDAGEADFPALVAERGLDLSDIDLGDVTAAQLGPAAEGVFAAEAGDVVGPLETSLGPALFRVNAILAAQEVPFEEAEPDLRAELANQRARRMIADSTEAITDLIAGGATVEDLAERTDLELGSIAWSAGSTEGIAAYDAFRAAAASAREGAPPRLEQFDDGGIFVLRLDSVTPPALRPFEEVRDEVAALWRREATRAAVAAEAERLAARLRTGGGFDQPDLGLVPVVETGMTRRDFLPGAPPDFLARIFALSMGEVAVIPAEDGTIIARLTAIAAPDPTDPAVIAERARIAEQTMQAIGNDIYQAFTAALQAGTDITVDEAAIAAIHSRMQ